MIVVTWPVQICWHHGMKQHAVLSSIVLAHFQPGDLCNRISLVRGFQRSSQKARFTHWLWRHPGINASTSQEQKPRCATTKSRTDAIGGHAKIVVNKVGGIGVVGINPPDTCRRKNHDLGLVNLKKLSRGSLVTKIQLRPILANKPCLLTIFFASQKLVGFNEWFKVIQRFP